MRIESLSLQNFRNYETVELEFSQGVNLLFGDNAQGKTNLLESIYVAATTRSFRGGKDKELIRKGEEQAHITLKLRKDDILHKIDMHFESGKRKTAAIDGIPIKRSAELFGLLHAISFSPDDMDMVKEGPERRRRFLDMELCQLDKIYLSKLADYNKALAQRNALLKQIGTDRSLLYTLDVWDRQLCECAKYLIREREHFTEELGPILEEKHNTLSKGKEHLTMKYLPNVTGEEMYQKLQQNREKDMYLKSTSVGPHRDDVHFAIDEMDVRMFGSQGQQRTVVLSIKLAEIEMVKRKIHDLPVLLLDDVLSELDRNRQIQLLGEMKDIQTIVTCTGMEEFITERTGENKVFFVKEGSVTKSQGGTP